MHRGEKKGEEATGKFPRLSPQGGIYQIAQGLADQQKHAGIALGRHGGRMPPGSIRANGSAANCHRQGSWTDG